MIVNHDIQFATTMARRLGTAARINLAASVRTRRQANYAATEAQLTSYDPIDPATTSQPYAAYRRLHQGARVHYSAKRSIWILCRFGDVRDAARAAGQLSSAEGVTRPRFDAPFLLTTDGEQHAQMRRHILPAFTKPALESWRPTIDHLAAELVDAVLQVPGSDVVQRLAVPMPMRLIAKLLGVPESDVAEFRRWSQAAVEVTDLSRTPRGAAKLVRSVAAQRKVYQYFRHQFQAGGLRGSDTIIGRLLAEKDAGSVSDDELFHFAFLLLLAGNETTTNLLAGMFDTLAHHPNQFDLIRADQTLIPLAVEELLRYTSPVQNLFRTACADYPVGDVTIPTGARVQLSFGAANRDPRIFPEPDIFRVDRNPNPHLAFGYGPHLCPAAQLARMEAQAVLRELATRASRISISGPNRWSTNCCGRGPAYLPIRLTPA